MVDLQTISLLVQIVGVSATAAAAVIGVRSYINSNKRAQETKDRELETRKAWLFMQIFIVNQGKELADSWFKLYSMDLGNPRDIVEKIFVRAEEQYREVAHNIAAVGTHYDGIGLYARKGLIDLDMVKELLSGDVIMMWEKLKPLLMEIRKTTPFTVENFEWLYDKLKSTQIQSSASIR